ncbi:methyltransferase [Nonomuraea sp. NPDC048892]|uniref:methyltransferase n=1 Tax=Nonomuraea sp. NPDC048892 TaxID=3154624 RepID=UPI000AE0E565
MSFDDSIDAGPILGLSHQYFAYTTALAAVELRLFDLLAGRTLSEAEIRAELGLHPRLTADFLDSLVAVGLLTRETGDYGNTRLSDHYLREQSPTNVIRYVKGAQFRWQNLLQALRSGEPLVTMKPAGATMDNLRQGKDDWRKFFAWADYLASARNVALARQVDWSGVVDFVDAGGGNGTAAAHVVRDNPHVRATVFDLPNAKPAFEEQMARLGTQGKVSFQTGDLFADPLPRADAVLFGGMLIDWSEEQRLAMLRSAYEALRPGGVVLAANHMLDDARSSNVASFMVSLNIMLVSKDGRVPLMEDCRSWLLQAGFARVEIRPLAQGESLIVGHKDK